MGTYLLTLRREAALRKADPFAPGFLAKYDRYERVSDVVAPLSGAAGALLATAVASSPRAARWGSRLTAYASLALGAALLGTGLAVTLPTPAKIADTNVPDSSRQTGALLLSGAAPFLSYGVTFLLHGRSVAGARP